MWFVTIVIIERKAKFYLKVSENKDVTFISPKMSDLLKGLMLGTPVAEVNFGCMFNLIETNRCN